jgi:hypothetical protein
MASPLRSLVAAIVPVLLAALADRRWIPSSTVEGLIAEHRALTVRISAFRQSRESLEKAIGEAGVSDISRRDDRWRITSTA